MKNNFSEDVEELVLELIEMEETDDEIDFDYLADRIVDSGETTDYDTVVDELHELALADETPVGVDGLRVLAIRVCRAEHHIRG